MTWKKNKTKIIETYQKQFDKFGVSSKSLFFPDRKQNVRFNVIREIGITSKDSVLDIGCGFGDLLKFLQETIDLKGHYTGMDITPEFIKESKKKFPKGDFRLMDILDNTIDEKWDYVVLAGTLNFDIGAGHKEFIKMMIKRMFELSKKGVSIDLISNQGDNRNEHLYRADPIEIFTYCKTLSKRVNLRSDYMPYEFAVYLYKDEIITDDKIFRDYNFPEIIKY